MQPDALMILNSPAGSGPHLEKGIEPIGGSRDPFMANNVTSFDGRSFTAAEIERHSLAPRCGVDRLVVHLNTPHTKHVIARKTPHAIAHVHFPALCRSGDDQSVARKREGPVHR